MEIVLDRESARLPPDPRCERSCSNPTLPDERGEAALPQVPSPALPEVDPPGVPAMCLADGATQALSGLRDNDQVNMMGHQAICPDRDLLCAAESRHALEVVLVVFLTEEWRLLAHPDRFSS